MVTQLSTSLAFFFNGKKKKKIAYHRKFQKPEVNPRVPKKKDSGPGLAESSTELCGVKTPRVTLICSPLDVIYSNVQYNPMMGRPQPAHIF